MPNYSQQAEKNNLFRQLGIKNFDANDTIDKSIFENMKGSNSKSPTKKLGVLNSLKNNIDRALNRKIYVRPYRKLRIICIVLVNMLYYINAVKKVKKEINNIRKPEQIEMYNLSMKIFITWIIDSFSSFFRSMFNSESENLNFTKVSYDAENHDKINKIFEQVEFRVIYFLKYLNKITLESMPKLLIDFLHDLVQHGSFIHKNFVTEYENSRLCFDINNTLFNVNDNTK